MIALVGIEDGHACIVTDVVGIEDVLACIVTDLVGIEDVLAFFVTDLVGMPGPKSLAVSSRCRHLHMDRVYVMAGLTLSLNFHAHIQECA